MGFKLAFLCILAAWVASARSQSNGKSALCQRFPNNPNCGGSSGSSSSSSSSSGSSSSSSSSSTTNAGHVDPVKLGLPPPPVQGGSSQPQPSQPSLSASNDPCSSWRPTYDRYCLGATIPQEYQPSCRQFQQTCLGQAQSSSNNDPCSSWRPVYDKYCLGVSIQQQYQASCTQFQQACLTGGGGLQSAGAQPQPQPQPQGALGSSWAALTQKAQAEQEQQAQQSLMSANNGQPNCGEYQKNYVVWCGGAKPINELYCNTLGRMCQHQAAQAAAGQPTSFGPFANSNGLPTGGGGSTRPLAIGSNFGVGPFFDMGRNFGLNPMKGFGMNEGIDVLGLGIRKTSGVDWGGLIGPAQAGALLGRRRRWANFGNVVYFVR